MRDCTEGFLSSGLVAKLILVLLFASPVSGQAGKLEVIQEPKAADVVLTRGQPKAVCLDVRNPSEEALELGKLEFAFGDRGKAEPATTPRPTLAYARGVTLTKNQTMTTCLVFSPYPSATEYDGELYFTSRKAGARPELFHTFLIRVLEEEGVTLNRRIGGWIAATLAAVVIVLPFTVRGRRGNSFFQSPKGDYSVSRFQVWLWTAVVLFSYAFLFFTVGPNITIPDTLLGLMGITVGSISAATTIAVGKGKQQGPPLAGGGGASPQSPQPAAPLPSAASATSNTVQVRQNWLSSMLSEQGEPSAMRLQMFAWTIATIVLFLWRVFSTATLWDVPGSLLVFMGISHAGYLVDKSVQK